ncbi:unnamed protein product [Closterium sp. NIES-64]|nr:unnamed protein product [Closterium sp. NIES-64]
MMACLSTSVVSSSANPLSASLKCSESSSHRSTLGDVGLRPSLPVIRRGGRICGAAKGGRGAVCVVASGGNEAARTADEVETGEGTGSFDVSSTCVNPVFRSFPSLKEGDGNADGPGGRAVRVLFLSEGNVCRSVVAEAVLTAMVRDKGLEDYIVCSSKAVRDYNVGENPDSRVVQLAGQSGVAVDAARQAALLRPAEDVVAHDLLVVMDKFNAADVLKEVSVFDTIDPTARFSSKVRRMGDFCKSRTVDDIDDPLYGNMGGPEELELLGAAINDIVDCCDGLLTDLIAIRAGLAEGESFRSAVNKWLQGMDDMDWLVPPMLQKKNRN